MNTSEIGLLLTAVAQRKIKLIRILLDGGCNVDYQGYDGKTALAVACSFLPEYYNTHDVDRFVKILLDYKANPNIQDMKGRTPLVYALYRRLNPDLVELLLNHGADPTVKDKEGVNALMLSSNKLYSNYKCYFARYLKFEPTVNTNKNDDFSQSFECALTVKEQSQNFTKHAQSIIAENHLNVVHELLHESESYTFKTIDRRISLQTDLQKVTTTRRRNCFSNIIRPVIPSLLKTMYPDQLIVANTNSEKILRINTIATYSPECSKRREIDITPLKLPLIKSRSINN